MNNKSYLHDQRGVAMILELVLIVAVLGLVGMALYQASQHAPAAVQSSPASNAAAGLASSAAAATEADSTADAALSADAESTIDDLTETDVDVANLGGSSAGTF